LIQCGDWDFYIRYYKTKILVQDYTTLLKASVKMGADLSNFVNIERGVKQGDSLIPIYLKFI
jgi:hypothetical protein